MQIVNASLISEGLLDGKHRTVYIPVNDIAHELGNVKLANMLAMGAGIVGKNLAENIVDTFLNTQFEGGRHERRVNALMAIENDW